MMKYYRMRNGNRNNGSKHRNLLFHYSIIPGTIAVLSLLLLSLSFAQDSPKVRILFFYSETCDHCQDVLANVIPVIKRKYPVEFKFLEVNDPANYQLLLAVERKYKDHDNKDYPIIFFDKYSFSGEKEIAAGFEESVALVAGAEGCPFADEVDNPLAYAVEAAPETPAGTADSVYLAYFYEVGCQECARAKTDMTVLKKEHPGLAVASFDIDRAQALNEALCKKLGVPEEYRLSAPMIFIGDDWLREEDVNYHKLKQLIIKYEGSPHAPPWNIEMDTDEVKRTLVQRFLSISVLAIFLAGLLDGVNPCAFATMVFFISYLSLVGRKGREIIWVGSAFTAAIFITYLAVGLGFFQFIKSLSFLPLVSKIVYSITIVLALVFGTLSFYDFFKYRKGDYGESMLKLPGFLRKRLNKVIREQSRMSNFVVAAFISGFLVSLLEFACTGQVYLPTVIFVTKIPDYKLRGMLLLVLYNIAFIIPLIAIFLLAYKGVTSQKLNTGWKKYAPHIKIGLGIFFYALAALLIVYL